VAAGAGDSREGFLDALPRAPHGRAEGLMRAAGQRGLAPGAAHGSLGEAMQGARSLGQLPFQ
jgi:hypothetical protein